MDYYDYNYYDIMYIDIKNDNINLDEIIKRVLIELEKNDKLNEHDIYQLLTYLEFGKRDYFLDEDDYLYNVYCNIDEFSYIETIEDAFSLFHMLNININEFLDSDGNVIDERAFLDEASYENIELHRDAIRQVIYKFREQNEKDNL